MERISRGMWERVRRILMLEGENVHVHPGSSDPAVATSKGCHHSTC